MSIEDDMICFAYQQRLQPEEAILPHLHLSDSLGRWRSLGKRAIAVPWGEGHKRILKRNNQDITLKHEHRYNLLQSVPQTQIQACIGKMPDYLIPIM